MTLELGPQARSATVDLTNRADTPLRLEVKALAWEMAPDGTAPPAPATEIVVFPQFVTIPAHETRRIRAATLSPEREPLERAYRLSLAEIPEFDGPSRKAGVNLTFTTTYILGVYLGAATVRHEASIDRAEVHHGQVSFDIRDSGTVHEHLTAMHVTGLGAGARAVFEKSLDPTIALAGHTRTFDVVLTSAECTSARAVTIGATAGSQTLMKTIDLAAEDCGP